MGELSGSIRGQLRIARELIVTKYSNEYFSQDKVSVNVAASARSPK